MKRRALLKGIAAALAFQVTGFGWKAAPITTEPPTIPGITFSRNGLAMFSPDVNGKNLMVWDLATAWDISTATYNTSFTAHSLMINPRNHLLPPAKAARRRSPLEASGTPSVR